MSVLSGEDHKPLLWALSLKMNESLFITLWIIACALLAFSSFAFFIVKKPEYTINRLMEHPSMGYWYKNLDQVVPKRWVSPIYYSALIGAFVGMVDVLWLVISNV